MIRLHLQSEAMVALVNLVLTRLVATRDGNMLNRLTIFAANENVGIIDYFPDAFRAVLLRRTCLASFMVSTCRIEPINWFAVMQRR